MHDNVVVGNQPIHRPLEARFSRVSADILILARSFPVSTDGALSPALWSLTECQVIKHSRLLDIAGSDAPHSELWLVRSTLLS